MDSGTQGGMTDRMKLLAGAVVLLGAGVLFGHTSGSVLVALTFWAGAAWIAWIAVGVNR